MWATMVITSQFARILARAEQVARLHYLHAHEYRRLPYHAAGVLASLVTGRIHERYRLRNLKF